MNDDNDSSRNGGNGSSGKTETSAPKSGTAESLYNEFQNIREQRKKLDRYYAEMDERAAGLYRNLKFGFLQFSNNVHQMLDTKGLFRKIEETVKDADRAGAAKDIFLNIIQNEIITKISFAATAKSLHRKDNYYGMVMDSLFKMISNPGTRKDLQEGFKTHLLASGYTEDGLKKLFPVLSDFKMKFSKGNNGNDVLSFRCDRYSKALAMLKNDNRDAQRQGIALLKEKLYEKFGVELDNKNMNNILASLEAGMKGITGMSEEQKKYMLEEIERIKNEFGIELEKSGVGKVVEAIQPGDLQNKVESYLKTGKGAATGKAEKTEEAFSAGSSPGK